MALKGRNTEKILSAPPSDRILVVDDEPLVSDIITRCLEAEGYPCHIADCAESALDLVDQNQYALIISDMMMPGKSGVDLMVRIRKDPKLEEIPLVIVTGSDTILEDDCQAYLGSHHGIRGPDGVLGKPIDQRALLAVLKHLTR